MVHWFIFAKFFTQSHPTTKILKIFKLLESQAMQKILSSMAIQNQQEKRFPIRYDVVMFFSSNIFMCCFLFCVTNRFNRGQTHTQ